MKERERREYKLMHEIGKKRFTSDCRHEKVRNGYCMNCLRRVIDKI